MNKRICAKFESLQIVGIRAREKLNVLHLKIYPYKNDVLGVNLYGRKQPLE